TLALEEDVFRGNGIQFISTSESIDTSTSLPARGAWIEMLHDMRRNEKYNGRSPPGERGLKLDYLRRLADDPALVQRVIDIANGFSENEHADNVQDIVEMKARLAEIESKLRSVIDFITAAGVGAPQSLMNEIRELESEKARVQEEIDGLNNPPASLDAEALLKSLRQVTAMVDKSLEE
ncbi:MAG: hypothetical protein RSC90_11880, partial [Clostridia bacterium]